MIAGRITDAAWTDHDGRPILVLTLITDNEALVEYVDVMPLDERAVYTIGELVTFAAGEYRLVKRQKSAA